jgi:peptidoglycan/xylan/chitin deacetylase (PgdA/CDA1 family)
MKVLKIILLIILSLLILTYLIRFSTPTEIDDIHPNRLCGKEYLLKSDIFWVIPLYQNISVAKNKTWCQEILKLNKTIGMHGITHEYHEFDNSIKEREIEYAKQEFQNCFGYPPTIFKAPYLKLSKENKQILKKQNLTIKSYMNQNIHKVYHCQDSGRFPNWFHDIF